MKIFKDVSKKRLFDIPKFSGTIPVQTRVNSYSEIQEKRYKYLSPSLSTGEYR